MREEGYYFVLLEGKWEIAKYYNSRRNKDSLGYWNSLGWEQFYHDFDFEEIGDKIELPKD